MNISWRRGECGRLNEGPACLSHCYDVMRRELALERPMSVRNEGNYPGTVRRDEPIPTKTQNLCLVKGKAIPVTGHGGP
jgi:hypothetical protein